MKIGLATPERPDDAGALVGERDRGLVVPASGRQGDGPLLQPRQSLRVRAVRWAARSTARAPCVSRHRR